MVLVTLLRRGSDRALSPSVCHVRTQHESDCKSGKRALSRIQPCWHPDLRLPTSRAVRNTFLSLKSLSLWYFVIAAQTD